MQLVELHYRRHARPDFAGIKARAEAILGAELGSSPHEDSGARAFLIIHTAHPIQYTEGAVPAQTALLATEEPPRLEDYTQEAQQSWRCEGAEALLRGGVATLLVTEMMARLPPPQTRVALFHGVLQAVAEVTAPDALVFKHSQQVVAPADYLAACHEAPIHRPGALNVRFFRIANSGGDLVMDTRGLQEVGLHDLQCHFRGLPPNDVSRVLFNTAVYLFENGPVIESGHTVAGTPPQARWRCQFENSLLEPRRELLDLNPGAPYAAGMR